MKLIIKGTNKGFTIVELMITMVVFVLAIAAASSVFTGLLTQFKQQSKVAETNIEGAIGLEMMRQDLEKAGFGLPWTVTGVADADADGNYWEHLVYTEAASAPASNYNDVGAGKTGPRSIVGGNNLGPNGSDYLVIKAVGVATNYTAGKWTTLSPLDVKKTWLNADGSNSNENVNKDNSGVTSNAVRVIVLSPGATTSNSRSLIVAGGTFYTQYSNTAAFAPGDATDVRIIYGVDPDTNLRMPFNRADYSIKTTNVPAQCATGTGVLTKTVISQSDGGTTNALPIIDCAASMQLVLGLDMDGDGRIGTYSKPDGSVVVASNGASIPGTADAPAATVATVQTTLASASLLRDRLKEVRVYVLAHEGQIDRTFTFNNFPSGAAAPNFRLGEFGVGRDITLSAITNYLNYRWKVYTLVVKPNNLK